MFDISSDCGIDEYETLKKELTNHSKKLIKKPKILLITKSDLIIDEEHNTIDCPKDIDSIIISSVNGSNIPKSIQAIKNILEL